MPRRREEVHPDPTVTSLGLITKPGQVSMAIWNQLQALEAVSGTQITVAYFQQFGVFQAEAKRPGQTGAAALACCSDPLALYEELRHKLETSTAETDQRDGDGHGPV